MQKDKGTTKQKPKYKPPLKNSDFTLILGFFSLCLWLFILTRSRPFFAVYRLMNLASDTGDGGYLFAAAGLLVLFNTLRAVFLYLGWFFVGDGLAELTKKKSLATIVPTVAIPLSYQILALLEAYAKPHFGVPAIMGVLTVILVRFLTKDVPGRLNSALAISIMLFSFQWLDIVPALTEYGFGWGEISMAVKELAVLMDRKNLLDLLGIIAFLTVLSSGLITSELLVLSTLQIKSMQKIREQERHLAHLREEHLRTRSSREIQNLVHDLKRPLTTIVGLLDVLGSSPNFPQNHKKHLDVAKDAALGMNQMISEILSSSSKRITTIEGIISYVMAQVSPLDFHKHVKVIFGENCREKRVEMNVVRFSRALVNLLDNASRAAKSIERKPQILLEARCDKVSVTFIIKDNGPGFDQVPTPDSGSTWNSTGLGLAFTKEVVLEHGGNISMTNAPTGGGIVTIHLPLKKEESH